MYHNIIKFSRADESFKVIHSSLYQAVQMENLSKVTLYNRANGCPLVYLYSVINYQYFFENLEHCEPPDNLIY